jgi:FixJ family two-component response regulator
VTDVVMPELNGRELGNQVRALRPEAAILYMSGYSDRLMDSDGVLEAGLHFLPKPITPAALVQAVRAAIDAEDDAHAALTRKREREPHPRRDA